MTPQLNRWLNRQAITNVLRRIRGLLVIPSTTFTPNNQPWAGFSERVIQFNYSLSNNLSIKADKTFGYILDTGGLEMLDTRLCWCIRNIIGPTFDVGSKINYNNTFLNITSFDGTYNEYQWTGLDPSKSYLVTLDNSSYVIRGGDTLDIKVNSTANTTTTYFFNTTINVSVSIVVDNYQTSLMIVQEYKPDDDSSPIGMNTVIRYKLNTNEEVIPEAIIYAGQKLLGNFVSIEGWTTPDYFGDAFTQPQIKLNTSILGDLDTRNGLDFDLNPTAIITNFGQLNIISQDNFPLPITYDPLLVNGLAS
jgi:hypothetical protein